MVTAEHYPAHRVLPSTGGGAYGTAQVSGPGSQAHLGVFVGRVFVDGPESLVWCPAEQTPRALLCVLLLLHAFVHFLSTSY